MPRFHSRTEPARPSCRSADGPAGRPGTVAAGDLHARSVSWGVPGRTILHGVDVTAQDGLVTGLIGPNGSGKTSLLHLMAGLRRPFGGRVLLAGRDLGRMPAWQRARAIALLEQHTDTRLRLSVEAVVELGRTPYLRRWQPRLGPADRDIVHDAMAIAQVEHLAERDWATLSGGERQRVHLARALAQQPTVLLLDEPTNHLDIGHQLHFFETIRQLHVTVLAALHDLQIAAAYCDRIAVLHDGILVADGTPARVLTPGLLHDVYGIDATVEPHPRHGHPTIRWNRPGIRPAVPGRAVQHDDPSLTGAAARTPSTPLVRPGSGGAGMSPPT